MQGFTIRFTRGSGDQAEILEISTEPACSLATVTFPRIETSAALRFNNNGDGTVTDTDSGLMWSQDDVTPKSVKHAAAAKACAELRLAGHADWRLPTRAELLTLIDDTRQEPAIDVEAFPSCKSGWYWTSTLAAWSSGYAWVVDFGYGNASYDRRGYDDGFVRAVRSVPAGQ